MFTYCEYEHFYNKKLTLFALLDLLPVVTICINEVTQPTERSHKLTGSPKEKVHETSSSSSSFG
jgi:hypothetical protein